MIVFMSPALAFSSTYLY